MHRIFAVTVLIALLAPGPVQAQQNPVPQFILESVPGAARVGTARLSVMFWNIYDATLYAPGGEWREGRPFALTLAYLRALDGDKIADRSAEEIRKLGYGDEAMLAGWHGQMRKIFPDVDRGTRLTGVYTSGGATEFYNGDTLIGRIDDAAFGAWFFDIWLGENTSEPHLRRQLLALK